MAPHEFWQTLLPAGSVVPAEPFTDAYPATLPDGRILLLPIRSLPGTDKGLASLIINQASFAVQAALTALLSERLRAFAPDVVVGLPTLGLTIASAVAVALGHTRYVPLGTSRKFWYDDALSAAVASVTTPDEKRLYLDPRLVPLLQGRRVALVDDVLSTGRSIAAGLDVLRTVGIVPVAIGALMLQTDRWRSVLSESVPRVVGLFRTPMLQRKGGWIRTA